MSHFGNDKLEVLPNLVPEIQHFLQEARIILDEPNKLGGFSFFYWVNNLASPGNLFQCEEIVELALDPGDDTLHMKCEYKKRRFVLLYTLNQLASHSVGILYDQDCHLCILCPDFDDAERIFLKRTEWYPLNVILEYWLKTIRIGNIVALPEQHPKARLHPGPYIYPWYYMRFHKHMLDQPLEVFNKLVEAIEVRLPQRIHLKDNNSIENGLVDEDVLQLHEIPTGFVREFFEKARIPRFENIAPGLEVITTPTFSKQPFMPDTLKKLSINSVSPILLFYSKLSYNQFKGPVKPGGTGPFGYPYRGNTSFPAGLYLLETEMFNSDDLCKFILPFSIGGNGYARRTDGGFYGGNVPENSFEDLYSLGYHPFETTTTQNLASVLQNWLGMVESGAWQIDENGVAGGMEVWKDADTKEHWEKYVIKQDFGH
ncbi:hypothetical protein OPT61_g3468 [Boeremia exigua]|uniref:Uncharacterized protein n=1 Tax=Boeremia exigua TaxID=749465 RepID=A0ACC2IHU6_9PLEO|nr:hypothetical protein OPT61_g3468 [Boeremia exigua]